MKNKKWKPTKAWAKKYLPAVRELIKFYEALEAGDEFPLDGCPLCVKDKEFSNAIVGEKRCIKCPWVVYESRVKVNKLHCPCPNSDYHFRTDNGFGSGTALVTRIKRLKRWERKMVRLLND